MRDSLIKAEPAGRTLSIFSIFRKSPACAGTVFAVIWRMKVAIAYWTDRISPVFDVSDRLLLVDIEGGREHKREDIKLKSENPLERAREVSDLGVEVLICGAISNVLEILLDGVGIKVLGFLCGDLEFVLKAFISGKLYGSRFLMPGLRGKRRRFQIGDGRLFKIPKS